VGASAGIAIAPNHGSSIEELLSNADLALYDAKASGGGTARLFAPYLRARAQARHQLGNELRRAYANDEFVLHFQPQICARDGTIVGAEALLRWQHPEKGLLAPGAFIEALAASPIALEVGRWILINACQTAASWRAEGLHSLRIGVNLFAAQFRMGTLSNDVALALVESGLPAEALELEITENIALRSDEMLLATLQDLRARGISLAFDDFGTGYASLSYLAQFPLSRIKIDRSFVQKISNASNAQDTAIVRSIITMAHNLGLKVTAEGVETPAQAAFLKARKCDELQGFLYAKPMPKTKFIEMLASLAAAKLGANRVRNPSRRR
jgi:EAL domain-containing protein (putative c-di-GMP-specific phosphodiesterase class I)